MSNRIWLLLEFAPSICHMLLGTTHRGRAALLLRLSIVGGLVAGFYVAGRATGLSAWSSDAVSRWLAVTPAPAPLIFLGLFGVLNTLGVPMPVLCAAAGVAFGTVFGTGLTATAMLSTATLQFLVARHLGGGPLRSALAERLGRIGGSLQRRGTLAVAVARLLPGPFSEFNLAAGLSPVSFHDFVLGTVLGGVPKAVFWTGLGTVLLGT